MRTPRNESFMSGAAIGQRSSAGAPFSMSSAPIRTIGSGSSRPALARPTVSAERKGESSASAPARAKPGVSWSEAVAFRSASASAAPAQASWKAAA